MWSEEEFQHNLKVSQHVRSKSKISAAVLPNVAHTIPLRPPGNIWFLPKGSGRKGTFKVAPARNAPAPPTGGVVMAPPIKQVKANINAVINVPYEEEIPVDTNVDSVLSGACALGLPEGQAAGYALYRDTRFHADVLSCFIAMAMKRAGYSPSQSSIQGDHDAASKEAEGFSKFITTLRDVFSEFVMVKEAASVNIDNSTHSCNELQQALKSFAEEGAKLAGNASPPGQIADTLCEMVKRAAATLSKQKRNTSGTVKRTLYTMLNIDGGGARNPLVTIYWSTLNMKVTPRCKSTAYDNVIRVVRYTFQLNSSFVVAYAHELVNIRKPVSARALVDQFNE